MQNAFGPEDGESASGAADDGTSEVLHHLSFGGDRAEAVHGEARREPSFEFDIHHLVIDHVVSAMENASAEGTGLEDFKTFFPRGRRRDLPLAAALVPELRTVA